MRLTNVGSKSSQGFRFRHRSSSFRCKTVTNQDQDLMHMNRFENLDDDSFERTNSPDFFRLSKHPSYVKRSKIGIFGSARLANRRDLMNYLNPPDEASPSFLAHVSLLTESANGRRYDPLYGKTLYVPNEIRNRNLLAVGQTGAGKTSELIDPLIYSDILGGECSLIIIDAKGDSYQKHEPFLRAFRPDHPVTVINFADADRTTKGWNFLARTGSDENSDQDFAETICHASQGDHPRDRDHIYWFSNSSRFIAATISCLRRETGKVCPAAVHWMLERGHSDNVELWQRHPNVAFAAEALNFLRSGSHNAETVLSTAQGYLRTLRDRQLAAVTSVDEFRIVSLLKRPGILFIEIPQGHLGKIRPYVNIFLSEVFREVAAVASTMPGNRLKVPLRIHADDFVASAGRIHDMDKHLNMFRSFNVGLTAAVQSLSQIEEAYGTEAGSVLAGFSTKMFRPAVEQHDAEWASRQCGTMTAEVSDRIARIESGSKRRKVTESVVTRRVGRPLLLPEDIRYSPEHFAYGPAWTILLPDVRPVQGWLRASYHAPEMAAAMAQARRTARKAKLRESPLTWTHGNPLSARISGRSTKSNRDQHSIENEPMVQLRRTQVLTDKIGYSRASDEAREWWDKFLVSNPREGMIKLMEKLVEIEASLDEFYACSLMPSQLSVSEMVEYVHMRRLARKFEDRLSELDESAFEYQQELDEIRDLMQKGEDDLGEESYPNRDQWDEDDDDIPF
ncbi:type IV secretion system DNA-binding domain-containing protein [bacterium]|nr:type IV secretion system DNA-binding domain-containing protein [bacterium]